MQECDSNYKAFSEKRDEAQIADAMDRQKLLNVAIAEPPTSSGISVRPRRLVNLALGLFTAFFLACSTVFLAEVSRQNVCTPGELQAWGGYAVLATTPLREHEDVSSERVYSLLDGEDAHRHRCRLPRFSDGGTALIRRDVQLPE